MSGDLPEVRFFRLTYPVYVFVGPAPTDTIPTLIANEDDETCLPIFTDTDIAERLGQDLGWISRYALLKLDHCDSLMFFIGSRPNEEFSSVYVDPWKGVGIWRMSRADLIDQLKSQF